MEHRHKPLPLGRGSLTHHYEYRDGEGELHTVISECVDELRNWLDEVQKNSTLREQILQILFAIYLLDVEAGGIGFGEDAPTVLLEDTTAEERKAIAGWVREELSEKDATEWSGKFRKQWLGHFLLL